MFSFKEHRSSTEYSHCNDGEKPPYIKSRGIEILCDPIQSPFCTKYLHQFIDFNFNVGQMTSTFVEESKLEIKMQKLEHVCVAASKCWMMHWC